MEKSFYSTFLIFLFYRLSSIIIIQTLYVPDEYWQSLEVAHNMVFGYGYITWEWKNGLRSYLYPCLFAILYKVLELLSLDFPFLIILVPKILQAFLTAVSDQYFFLLCLNFGFQEGWAKVIIFTNWFWYYCGSRTITNTFETSFTIIALYYYPWTLFIDKSKGNKKSSDKMWIEVKNRSVKYLTLAAVNCLVRPTAITIWGPLVLFQFFSMHTKYLKQFILSCILPAVLFTLPFSLLVDYWWYGKFIIPAYNFLVFNIFQEISSFYGTHPFHWYLTQGLPVVLGLHYLPFVFGVLSILGNQLRGRKNQFQKIFMILVIVVAFNIAILSNIPHKEFRFVLPLTPMMMLIVVKISTEFFKPTRRIYKLLWFLLVIAGFMFPCVLIGSLHQRGPLILMDYLRNAVPNCTPNCSFLFLMPCHSTPLYSHLHVNVSTRFLTCEPPLTKDYYDESEDFFHNPNEWLNNYWDDEKPPSHVSFFDSIENSIGSFLKSKGFNKKHEFLHTLFVGKNLGRFIVVYEPSE